MGNDMSQVVAVQHQEYKPLTATEMQQQVNTIQHIMHQVMKKDVHYGIIPGCKQPSLFKPGAEKIMATFRLAADPEVTDMSTDDMVRYQVKVRLTSPSGVFVGSGVGECSSSEEKYRWRRTVCQEEFDETPPERRREKWKKYYQKPAFKEFQVRTDPADLANTVLKMAKKRAQVDAVLTATAASDCFTQDIEDMPDELRQEMVSNNVAPITETLTPEQIDQLKEAIKAAGVDEQYVCNKGKVDKLEDILKAHFPSALNHLKRIALGE